MLGDNSCCNERSYFGVVLQEMSVGSAGLADILLLNCAVRSHDDVFGLLILFLFSTYFLSLFCLENLVKSCGGVTLLNC